MIEVEWRQTLQENFLKLNDVNSIFNYDTIRNTTQKAYLYFIFPLEFP